MGLKNRKRIKKSQQNPDLPSLNSSIPWFPPPAAKATFNASPVANRICVGFAKSKGGDDEETFIVFELLIAVNIAEETASKFGGNAVVFERLSEEELPAEERDIRLGERCCIGWITPIGGTTEFVVVEGRIEEIICCCCCCWKPGFGICLI